MISKSMFTVHYVNEVIQSFRFIDRIIMITKKKKNVYKTLCD